MKQEQRLTAEFYESAGDVYSPWKRYAFHFWSAAKDGKDLVDIAIRNWQEYYAQKEHLSSSTWMCVQVWGYDNEGKYKCLGKRFSRRCPKSLKAY